MASFFDSSSEQYRVLLPPARSPLPFRTPRLRFQIFVQHRRHHFPLFLLRNPRLVSLRQLKKSRLWIDFPKHTSCTRAGEGVSCLASDSEFSICTLSSSSDGTDTSLRLPFARSSKNSAGFIAISGEHPIDEK